MKIVFFVLLCISMLFTGCGATTRSQIIKTDLRLRDYNRLHLMIATAGGAISFSGASMSSASLTTTGTPSGLSTTGVSSGISAGHSMSGQDQVIMAAQDIAFSLRQIGFDTVDRTQDADMVVLFSIGTVRYDPLAGWIADRAFIEFKDTKTGSVVCSIKANVQFITPTINTLVKKLVSEVKRYY